MTTLYQEGYKEGVRAATVAHENDADIAYVEGYTDARRGQFLYSAACTVIGGLVTGIAILFLRIGG